MQNAKVGEKVRANRSLLGAQGFPKGIGIITAVDGLGTSYMKVRINFDGDVTAWVDPGLFDRVD